MIHGICIEIHTKKFPILPRENEEIINEGMYGKALCQYFETELPKYRLEIPLFINEDWGWWIEVKSNEFTLGLQIYSDNEPNINPEKYAIISSVTEDKKWSWKKFKKIDVSNDIKHIMDALEKLLLEDPEITKVIRHDDFPF